MVKELLISLTVACTDIITLIVLHNLQLSIFIKLFSKFDSVRIYDKQ